MNLKELLTGIMVFLVSQLFASPGTPVFTKSNDGITILTDPAYTGKIYAVKLEVISDAIIRVLAAEGNTIPAKESLVVDYKTNALPHWTIEEAPTMVAVKTSRLKAVVQFGSGQVSFYDAQGRLLLSEAAQGRALSPTTHEGEAFFQMRQTWQTTPDDDWYGLGQHQDGAYNYRGRQVFFFQNNTEVAVPFLISPKKYGILWDNYSLTTAGDIRPFRGLETLQLTDKAGNKGWLTASYFNSLEAGDVPILEKAENSIDMPFLGDSKAKLPAVFLPEKGRVVWEGTMASQYIGEHQLRFTYGGSIRLWVDGRLVMQRWRRAWNPAPALLPVTLSGQPVQIKIEWIPEGGESYLSANWREPQPPEERDQFSFSSEAGQVLDYYFVVGANMDEVISGYRKLSGKAPIVPKWALGFWQSRERYKTQQELIDVVAEYRRRQIPIDNIVQDWSYWKENDWGSQDFDLRRFPNFDSAVKVLHDQYHARVMISVWPKFYEGIRAYQDFDRRGWLYRRNIADRQRDWIGEGYVSTFYDAFNAGARRGFWDLIHKKIYKTGIDAWWMDASEPDILSNVSPEKRKMQMVGLANGPAAAWLNAYPLQNAKGIYEGQRQADPSKRVFLLTRSGFAGSQRYAAAIWSGDIGATWHDMRMQIPAGLNFSMSGIPYWTMDIGGFVVERRFEEPNAAAQEEWREMMTRWYQFGAFVPLFRSHGQYPFREIYNIAPEGHKAYQSMVFYNRLRYRLMPYIYSLAGHTYHQDYTIMRGLVMDFPADPAVRSISDQYLFGPSLLINPVCDYKAISRSVYLPAGQGWYHLYTGKHVAGGQTITADAPYERMPVFVKAGSIIPVGPAIQYTDEKPDAPITIYVYKGANGRFDLYEDSGLTYDYEQGKFATIPMEYNEQNGTLTIGERQGSYAGMQAKRTFSIVTIGANAAVPFDPDTNKGIIRQYDGRKLTIKL